MNGPSLDGSVMLANICTMPISVPIMPKAGAQSPIGAINLLAFVEMGQEVVAVALEIVADEIGVVAVGDEADALGQERIVDLDLFQADRALLAGDFGEPGKFVNEVALAHAPQREGEFGAERQAVHDRGERKADEGGGGASRRK